MSLDNRTCFLVNLRDRLACVSCGKRPGQAAGYHSGFEYHHVQPRSQGGTDTADNLVLLCHDCHLRQHGKTEAEAFTAGLMPNKIFCKACGGALNPRTVEMNCGWYRCDACNRQMHLFNHFYGEPAG